MTMVSHGVLLLLVIRKYHPSSPVRPGQHLTANVCCWWWWWSGQYLLTNMSCIIVPVPVWSGPTLSLISHLQPVPHGGSQVKCNHNIPGHPPPPGTLHTTTLLMAPDGPRQTEQTKGEERSGLLGQARPGQGWDGLD